MISTSSYIVLPPLVDAHTAQHLYQECLMGELMRGRTVIVVSHHVMLVEPGADYIVALDNGRVQYAGDRDGFRASGVISSLLQSGAADTADEEKVDPAKMTIEEEMGPSDETEKEKDTHSADSAEGSGSGELEAASTAPVSEIESTAVGTEAGAAAAKADKKKVRKLVEDETRAVGRVNREVWLTYFRACGSHWYWIVFVFAMVLAALSPVAENGWLR